MSFYNSQYLDKLTSSGTFYNSFLAKYDTNGNCIYATKIGNETYCIIRSTFIDKYDNICVTGIYKDKKNNLTTLGSCYSIVKYRQDEKWKVK